MISSRIPGFHALSIEARLDELKTRCGLSEEEVSTLQTGGLPLSIAEELVENVVGLSSLPFSIATNFQMNGKDYLVPMCIEEPSVVAAASSAALLARAEGGFFAEADDSIMIGQVQLTQVKDTKQACENILQHEAELIEKSKQILPSLFRRGGGMRGLEVRILSDSDATSMGELVVHLFLDCQDAMGANLTNALSEGLAHDLCLLADAKKGLQILSNLTDRRCVRVRCQIQTELLASSAFSGPELRDRIVSASRFAEKDRYRAATHNKGIMNGVDALTIATGNDFRAVEAGAHAFAAQTGSYRPLSTWKVGPNGELEGFLEMPLSLGIFGGTLQVRPSVQLALRILGVKSAGELSALAGCVGLATNLSALRALSLHGIQKAHMPLQARSSKLRKDPTPITK